MLPAPTKNQVDVGKQNKLNIINPYMPLMINISLNGLDVLANFDTGASATCIDLDYYIGLFGLSNVKSTRGRLEGAGKNTLDCQGEVDVQIILVDANKQVIEQQLCAILIKNLC